MMHEETRGRYYYLRGSDLPGRWPAAAGEERVARARGRGPSRGLLYRRRVVARVVEARRATGRAEGPRRGAPADLGPALRAVGDLGDGRRPRHHGAVVEAEEGLEGRAVEVVVARVAVVAEVVGVVQGLGVVVEGDGHVPVDVPVLMEGGAAAVEALRAAPVLAAERRAGFAARRALDLAAALRRGLDVVPDVVDDPDLGAAGRAAVVDPERLFRGSVSRKGQELAGDEAGRARVLGAPGSAEAARGLARLVGEGAPRDAVRVGLRAPLPYRRRRFVVVVVLEEGQGPELARESPRLVRAWAGNG